MAKRIVVGGGTGFVGRALCGALLARGDLACVLTRSEHGPKASERISGVEYVGPRESWAGALRGADAVVNLAGAGVMDQRWSDARLRELRTSRVEVTRELSEAAVTHGVRVMLSASAIGYYGADMSDEVRDEDAPAGADALAKICVEWEAATLSAQKAGVRVVLPRIGIVLGKNGGALEGMLPAFKMFVGGPIGSGRQWMSFVHLQDLVASMLFALDRSTMKGPYNATAPNPVRMAELAKAIGKGLSRPSALPVPGFVLRTLLGEGRAEMLLLGQRVVPSRLLAEGFVFKFAHVEEAVADLI